MCARVGMQKKHRNHSRAHINCWRAWWWLNISRQPYIIESHVNGLCNCGRRWLDAYVHLHYAASGNCECAKKKNIHHTELRNSMKTFVRAHPQEDSTNAARNAELRRWQCPKFVAVTCLFWFCPVFTLNVSNIACQLEGRFNDRQSPLRYDDTKYKAIPKEWSCWGKPYLTKCLLQISNDKLKKNWNCLSFRYTPPQAFRVSFFRRVAQASSVGGCFGNVVYSLDSNIL